MAYTGSLVDGQNTPARRVSEDGLRRAPGHGSSVLWSAALFRRFLFFCFSFGKPKAKWRKSAALQRTLELRPSPWRIGLVWQGLEAVPYRQQESSRPNRPCRLPQVVAMSQGTPTATLTVVVYG